MIYSNKSYSVKELEMSFGKFRAITLGERGRGRHQVILPVPDGIDGVKEGLNPGLEIGISLNGKPRISRCARDTEDNLYLILSSCASYTRKGNGSVWFYRAGYDADFNAMTKSEEGAKTLTKLLGELKNYIVKGWGADGDAGRIGKWGVYLLKGKPGDKFMVRWGGHGYGIEDTLYIINNCKGSIEVVEIDKDCVDTYYDQRGEEAPKTDKDGAFVDFCYFD